MGPSILPQNAMACQSWIGFGYFYKVASLQNDFKKKTYCTYVDMYVCYICIILGAFDAVSNDSEARFVSRQPNIKSGLA